MCTFSDSGQTEARLGHARKRAYNTFNAYIRLFSTNSATTIQSLFTGAVATYHRYDYIKRQYTVQLKHRCQRLRKQPRAIITTFWKDTAHRGRRTHKQSGIHIMGATTELKSVCAGEGEGKRQRRASGNWLRVSKRMRQSTRRRDMRPHAMTGARMGDRWWWT